MSWDLWVFAADTPMVVDAAGQAQFPDDFLPSPLGTADAVRAALSGVFPALDWADPAWGQLDGDGFSIEFALGDEDPCGTMTMFARGNATPAVLRLIDATGWHVLDTTTGAWMNLSADPDAGRRAFEAYKRRAFEAHKQTVLPSGQLGGQVIDVPKKGLWHRLFGR